MAQQEKTKGGSAADAHRSAHPSLTMTQVESAGASGVLFAFVPVVAALILLCVPLAHAGADKPTSLSRARAAVKANMATPEGQEYENTLSDDFWMSHSDAVTKCVDVTSSSHGKVEVLVKFAKDGAVGEVLITPNGSIADCLRQNLLKEKFPPPPKADYWMHVDMQFQK